VTPSPNRTLLASLVAVAASTAAFPWIRGYGTDLFQIVALGAAALVARVTSDAYADQHLAPVLAVALVLNLVLFGLPATLIWGVTRVRWKRFCVYALLSWCAFYVASLFLLFPATDGP
jgi:hypothetical protein